MSEAGTIRPHAFSAQDVLDRAALQHLVTAYCHGIDRRDYALLHTLYHDDAIDDHTPYYCGPAQGYIKWLPSMLDTWKATSHSVGNMLFLIDGDCAEGEVGARAWHLTLDGTREFIAWGRYADRYERREGVWRFLHRSFILDHAEERPTVAGQAFGAEGVGTGKPGRDDPVYARLPMLGAERTKG